MYWPRRGTATWRVIRCDHVGGMGRVVLATVTALLGAAACVLAPVLPGERRAAADPGPEGRLVLVGHDPLMSRGMNSALAIAGDHAYVGSRTDGTHANAG